MVLALYSSMKVVEPLSTGAWKSKGWRMVKLIIVNCGLSIWKEGIK